MLLLRTQLGTLMGTQSPIGNGAPLATLAPYAARPRTRRDRTLRRQGVALLRDPPAEAAGNLPTL